MRITLILMYGLGRGALRLVFPLFPTFPSPIWHLAFLLQGTVALQETVGTAPGSGSLSAAQAAPEVAERARYLMGTSLRVRVEAPDRTRALEAVDEVFSEAARLEALLSTWDPDSGMAAVNQALPGTPLPTDAELVGLLALAEHWAVATGRAFDPEVGPLIDAWDLRGRGRIPSDIELEQALDASQGRGFTVDSGLGTVTRHHSRAWIDTGAFGKGAVLERARAILETRRIRSAFLDFGGQVLVLGEGAGDGRGVAVAHPAQRSQAACVVFLEPGTSASTSGPSEQSVVIEGLTLPHIVDPRTGRPASTWGSVTVVTRDAVIADILSTALYVMGPDVGLAWAQELEDVGLLFLELHDGRVVPRWNASLERLLDPAGDLCPGLLHASPSHDGSP